MKLTLSLIKSFLPLDLPSEKIGEILTLLGIEVDAILNPRPSFANVVIGEVLSVQKHPDAKNLQVATVSDGQSTFSVVCGASNCRANMKTAFAKVGAVLTDADGRQRKIEKTSIRGVESFGMLCSAAELHLSHHHEGILDLPLEWKTGTDAVALLWDPVLELSLTPNLGHCMSALGIARELSAALQIPLSLAPFEPKKLPSYKVTVHDTHLCPRYTCLLIEGVKVGSSPFSLKQQLEACAQKSINHVVDAANYIMLKWGQPLHAFDADLIEGDLHVKTLKEPCLFLGLDGETRELPAQSLVIADDKKVLALAGIMGGMNSCVSEKTTRILLESALFDPISIRNTTKRLALRTESSQRFEKGIDPEGLMRASFEAARLIGGHCVAFTDITKGPIHCREISYRTQRINQLLGVQLSETEVEELLGRLQIVARQGKARIPTYRQDLCEEIDLVEEIARIYGYNNIEKRPPHYATSSLAHDPIFLFEQEMRQCCVASGLTEFLTCDLISPFLAGISQEITPPAMEFLKTIYSKSEEFSVLRTSLLPGLLQVVKGNFAQKNENLSAFEIGRIHFLQKGKVVEIPMLALLLTGARCAPHWSQKATPFDFFDLKGIVEHLSAGSFSSSNHVAFHPGRQADLQIDDLIAGSLGEVHPRLLQKFGIDKPVYYAELNLLTLLQKKHATIRMKPLPQFPGSERDWTLPLPLKMPMRSVFDAIGAHSCPLLETVELIDLYLPEGQEVKNATFRFVYRDAFKTLSLEEVEKEHTQLMDAVLKTLAK